MALGAALSKLVVKVDADIGNAVKNLNTLGKEGKSSLAAVDDGAAGATSSLGATAGAAAVAVGTFTALGAAALSTVRTFTSYASEVRGFQRVTGTSAETASKFTFALDELGVGSEAGAKAMFQLEKRVGTGKDGLAQFGITVARTSSGNLNLEKTLYNISDAYNSTRDQGTKAAIVFSAFGKQGQALIPVLQRGREGLKEFFDQAGRTNHILSQEDLDRAKKFDLAVKELNSTFEGLKIKAGNALTPLVTDITKMLSSLVQLGDKLHVFDAMGIAAAAALKPISDAVEVTKSFTDEIGLTSSESDKYSIVQKDLANNQAKYNDLVNSGKSNTKEAKDLLHLIGAESKYAGAGQEDLAKAMQTASQQAQQEQQNLDNLKSSLLGLGDATRGPTQALVGFQQSQIKLAEAQDALHDAQTKGIQDGESQAQFYRRIQGLQLDVQSSLLGVASAHDAVTKAGVGAVDAENKFNQAAADKGSRDALISQLLEARDKFGDTTGAIGEAIGQLQNYDKTNPAQKNIVVNTADSALRVLGLKSSIESLHDRTVTVHAVVDIAKQAFDLITGPLRGRASGGPVKAGTPYIVGENGPEIFTPKSSGTIIPNSGKVTASALSIGNAGGATYNVVVNTMVANAESGRHVVNAIKAHERGSGAGWRQ